MSADSTTEADWRLESSAKLIAPAARHCVLISGELGSGKTTTMNALSAALGGGVLDPAIWHLSPSNFADALKKECAEKAGVHVGIFYTEAGKETVLDDLGMTAGRFLQVHGEGRRTADIDCWARVVWQDGLRETEEMGCDRLFLIVGDCRHPNEIAWARANSDKCLCVRLVGDPNGVRARSTRDLKHISERALDEFTDWDVVIDTNVNDVDAVRDLIMHALHSRNFLD